MARRTRIKTLEGTLEFSGAEPSEANGQKNKD